MAADRNHPGPDNFKHVHTVRRRLADDRVLVHRYFRLSGERLSGSPGTEEFRRSYQLAKANYEGGLRRQPTQSEAPEELEPVVLTVTNNGPAAEPELLTPSEVSSRYRGLISPATLANWRALRIGPSYLKVGRAVLYPKKALDAWDRQNMVKCT